MATIKVLNRDGTIQEIAAADGKVLMQSLRDQGIEDILALCGGCCSCSTCHVYVDQALFDQLPPISYDENALLDSSEHRTSLSRLSCQLTVTPDWAGATIQIAPED